MVDGVIIRMITTKFAFQLMMVCGTSLSLQSSLSVWRAQSPGSLVWCSLCSQQLQLQRGLGHEALPATTSSALETCAIMCVILQISELLHAQQSKEAQLATW